MLVTNNLGTLQVNLFDHHQQEDNTASEQEQPTLDFQRTEKMTKAFQSSNYKRLQDEQAFKKKIFDQYREVYKRSPQLFSEDESYTLQPLSGLVSDLFDELTLQEVIDSMKMLGKTQIDNYEENLIAKLSEKYSSTVTIQQIYDNDMKQFLEFAKYWPKIFGNNALFSKLVEIQPENLDLDL